MRVVSVLVGEAVVHPGDPSRRTGIFKQPVAEIRAGYAGVEGDSVVDSPRHGGVDKAICCYTVAAYDHWREVYPTVDWVPGTCGENLTLEGLDESTVHLGDRFAIGEVVVQVSQPRGPCSTLSARVGIADFARVCTTSGLTGWHFRVLTPGRIRPGDALVLQSAHPAGLTITEANEIYYARDNAADLARLLSIDALAPSWREPLTGWWAACQP